MQNGKDAGKIKEKGAFITTPRMGKGFNKPIINIALKQYFINNIPVEKTLKEHVDILDFCVMQKVGKQFKVVHGDKPVQRINRYYISNKGRFLYKIKADGSKHNLVKGFGVNILNYVNSLNPKDYDDINYNYYISECNKIINTIKPKQLKLF